MARTKAAGVTPEVKEAIQRWQMESGFDVLGNTRARDAIARLTRHGCDPDTVILVLDLLHIYHHRDTSDRTIVVKTGTFLMRYDKNSADSSADS